MIARASRFDGQQRSLVRAAIEHATNLAIGTAHNDDWSIADAGRPKIASLRNFRFEAQIVPGGPSEDLLRLQAVHVWVRHQPVGRTCDPFDDQMMGGLSSLMGRNRLGRMRGRRRRASVSQPHEEYDDCREKQRQRREPEEARHCPARSNQPAREDRPAD
jgi:hypothetical protein